MSVIDDIFQPLYGKPSWNVEQGYGSFLTFEFGNPGLVIRELHEATPEAPESVRRRAAKRHVYVHGEWHLWIYLADWRILSRGEELANQECTRRVIKTATLELDGQALTHVSVDEQLLSVFEFDLGGRLEVMPNLKEYAADSELWLLYEPSGKVFTLRADGLYHEMPGDTNPEDYIWLPLA